MSGLPGAVSLSINSFNENEDDWPVKPLPEAVSQFTDALIALQRKHASAYRPGTAGIDGSPIPQLAAGLAKSAPVEFKEAFRNFWTQLSSHDVTTIYNTLSRRYVSKVPLWPYQTPWTQAGQEPLEPFMNLAVRKDLGGGGAEACRLMLEDLHQSTDLDAQERLDLVRCDSADEPATIEFPADRRTVA